MATSHLATDDIREAFVFEFMYTRQGLDPFEHTLPELVEMYDGELSDAKRRWPSINADHEWSEMQSWLSDRGITADQY